MTTATRKTLPPELPAGHRVGKREPVQTHCHEVGDLGALNHDGPSVGPAGHYVVEARMPPLGSSMQYRVKSQAEGFRRVVLEHRMIVLGAASP